MAEIQRCIHTAEAQYAFSIPGVGESQLCWDCRKTIAARLHIFKFGLLITPIDHGRLGYKCSRCGGEYTSTDPMTCNCPERKLVCRATRKAIKRYDAFADIMLRKPPRKDRSHG